MVNQNRPIREEAFNFYLRINIGLHEAKKIICKCLRKHLNFNKKIDILKLIVKVFPQAEYKDIIIQELSLNFTDNKRKDIIINEVEKLSKKEQPNITTLYLIEDSTRNITLNNRQSKTGRTVILNKREIFSFLKISSISL